MSQFIRIYLKENLFLCTKKVFLSLSSLCDVLLEAEHIEFGFGTFIFFSLSLICEREGA